MTVSFQLHNAEEINLISSLLLQLKQAGIHIQVIHPDTAAKHQKKINSGITERLYGIVKLPCLYTDCLFWNSTLVPYDCQNYRTWRIDCRKSHENQKTNKPAPQL